MPKWLTILLHAVIIGGGVVTTMNLGNTKTGAAVVAAAALANALIPSPVAQPPKQ